MRVAQRPAMASIETDRGQATTATLRRVRADALNASRAGSRLPASLGS
jgi:hypothetical protein